MEKDSQVGRTLEFAIEKEEAAQRFYLQLKDLLVKMASEELRHKEKVEYLYANTAFPQTSGG